MKRYKTVGALVGLVVLVLVACVLWLNVPRRVNLAAQAVAFRQSDGKAVNTVLHIEGEWTPDWFGGSDATFSGVIYVDGLDCTAPDTHTVSEMKFSAVSEGGYLAVGFVRSAATETWPSEVVGSIRLYRNDALDATVAYIMDDLEVGNNWLVVADCSDEVEAELLLRELPITVVNFE